MALQSTLFIWEKTLYFHQPEKGWTSAPLERLENAIAIIQEHFKKGTQFNIGYDAEILQTEYAECPMGGRNVVREALSTTHEAIGNMHTAWGYQSPWPLAGGGGNAGTFFSYETTPSLYLLIKDLTDCGYIVKKAFPLISIAMATGGTPGRTHIFLVVDSKGQAFVSLYTATGLRACRKLFIGKRKDDYNVWSEISMVFGEYGISFDDGSQRPQMQIFQAPGTDITKDCPYWDVLRTAAQTSVGDFEQLSLPLNSLPARHCSSLMEDLPRTVRLDFPFQVAAAVLAVILLGIGLWAFIALASDSSEISDLEAQESEAKAKLAHFEKNKREIETMRKLYSQDIFDYSRGRIKMLLTLPTAIPKEATITYLSAGDRNMPPAFRIGGVFWITAASRNASAQSVRSSSSTANTSSTTPITPIISTLENAVSGLFVNAKESQYGASNRDFVIVGTTPLPDPAPKFSALRSESAETQATTPRAGTPKSGVNTNARPVSGGASPATSTKTGIPTSK